MPQGERLSDEQVGGALRTLIGAWLRTHPAQAGAIRDIAITIAQEADAIASAERREAQPIEVLHEAAMAAASAGPPANAGPVGSARIVERPPVPLSAGFVPLKIGDGAVQIQVRGTSDEIARARGSAQEAAPSRSLEFRRVDLDLVVRRSQLKAEACAVAVSRRAAADSSEEPAQVSRLNALLQRAKQLDSCFLWMLFPDRAQPDDAALFQTRECYDNLARACAIVRGSEAVAQTDRRTTALALLAEAQSALRAQLEGTWLTRPDQCQEDAFQYLDEATAAESIYIERYMRLSDAADPAAWSDLRARLVARSNADALRESESKRTRNLLDKVGFHANRAQAAPDEREHHVRRIEEALAALEALAIPPEDPRVRERLRLLPEVPEELGLFPLLGRGLAGRSEEKAPRAAPKDYSPTVLRVREGLRDSVLVVVGGQRRQESVDRLVEAFELRDVDWVSLNEHSTAAPLHAPIARPEVQVVAVLIKLAGHQHVDEATAAARRSGKALVRVPAGYSPEQLAAQILEQASDKLAAATRAGKRGVALDVS